MKDLRVQRTYILLKDSLFKLLSKKAFEDIRVNDICNLAMIHRTTFYHHFQDKYELLEFCIQDIEQELLKKINRDNYTNSRKFYTNLIMGLLEYIAEKKSIFQNVLKHNSENSITEIFMKIMLITLLLFYKKKNNKALTII